jgi:rhodanese-related sulfurtransferase
VSHSVKKTPAFFALKYSKKMKQIFILLFIGMTLACTKQSGNVINLNAEEFHKTLASTPERSLLDIRTDGEIAQGMIPKTQQMEYGTPEFETEINKLDKNKPVFIYCAVGGRSASAVNLFTSKGFKKVYNLEGGISSWQTNGLPVSR